MKYALRPTIISLLLHSCISTNGPTGASQNNQDVNNPPSTVAIPSENVQVNKALENFSGKKFSLTDTKIVKFVNTKDSDNSMVAVYGEDKKLLISGPASIVNNNKITLDSSYKFFTIKERRGNQITSATIKNTNSQFLEINLPL